jgi:hypothetical protein
MRHLGNVENSIEMPNKQHFINNNKYGTKDKYTRTTNRRKKLV